ncbi:hypothetical protein HDE_08146 [Halotydeus destructor]|nr:hypothetical protein HDE_08146 [Halotydeus destructor]
MLKLFEEGTFADFIFFFARSSKTLHTSRFLLASKSELFYDIFDRDPHTPEHHVSKYSFETMKQLLSAMYVGKVDETKLKDSKARSQLLKAATEYKVETIKQQVEKLISDLDCVNEAKPSAPSKRTKSPKASGKRAKAEPMSPVATVNFYEW